VTKKELEEKIARLERELRAVQQQLNNHTCDRPVPIFMQPYIPQQPPHIQPGGQTSSPPPWPGNTWIVNVC
jgi:hypothetical protein